MPFQVFCCIVFKQCPRNECILFKLCILDQARSLCFVPILEMIYLNGKLSLLPRFKTSHFCFWCFWIIGVSLGAICAYINRVFIASIMGDILLAPVTPFGMITLLIVPSLFCLLVSYAKIKWLLFLYLIGKGFSCGFLLSAIFNTFSAYFLPVTVIFLFSETLLIIPALTLCKQCLSGKISYKSLSSFLVISLTIVSFDFFFVSPFLQIFFR